MALGTARAKQWNGMGKSRARQGKRQGGRADKAQKERQGPDLARKSQRGGSPVLLHPVAFRKTGKRGNGEQLEKRQGPDPARKSLRSGSAEEWQWQRHGKGSGKTMERNGKGKGKAGERQGL